MKKLFKKIVNKINNTGSGLVLVIVALGFVGILTGALLTAVAYTYRLKLYDYNAKSNFYYLEQAMDEIYAGVGSQVMVDMQEAYQDTREQISYFDTSTLSYKNVDDKEANSLFKDSFMRKIASSTFYTIEYDATDPTKIDPTAGIVRSMSNMISNSSVSLIPDKMKIVKMDQDGELYTGGTKSDGRKQELTKIVIKNVTLKRTAEYNRSQAKGTFTQTISSDIEVSRPDFDVSFSNTSVDADNLFKFCMLADSGCEINEDPGSVLTISGNVYAASDFYNKTYNRYDTSSEYQITQNEFTLDSADSDGNIKTTSYKMNKISNYAYVDDTTTSLRNENIFSKTNDLEGSLYNGYNDNSKYSGFYVNGANVNVVSNYLIVPGSISVMNGGDLSVYGVNGSNVGSSNVWTDEVVLAGYTAEDPNGKKLGSRATINANLYVKDDTQLEADSSKLKISGSYYGYSNSDTADNRVFVPTTKKDKNNSYNIFQELADDGTTVENRGHYNSSAIVVNSQNSTIDLTALNTMYIAGRSYIELSRQKTGTAEVTQVYDDVNHVTYTVNGKKNSYEYDATTKDYKTGESISIKTSQLAYVPSKAPRPVDVNNVPVTDDADADHYLSDVPAVLGASVFFNKYFGRNEAGNPVITVGSIPVVYRQEVINRDDGTTKTKAMYYIDFKYVADKHLYTIDDDSFPDGVNKADYLEMLFIKDYFDIMNYSEMYDDPAPYAGTPAYAYMMTKVDTAVLDTDLIDILTDVTYYEDYLAGEIALADQEDVDVKSYTSGVLTQTGDEIFKVNEENKYTDITGTTQTAKYNVILSKGSTLENSYDEITKTGLLGADSKTDTIAHAKDFSADYQKHYNYVKWALEDLDETSDEAVLVDDIVTKNGEGVLTPINKYMNFDNITDADPLMGSTPAPTDINPGNLDLESYRVWVSNGDVTVEADASDNNVVTGIVIAKGDVYFKSADEYSASEKYKAVKTFNGLVISGGKVYVNNQVTSINATDLCKNIINSCVTVASHANDTEDAALMAQAKRACRVLSLFKSYEDLSEEAINGTVDKDEDTKSITNIDYSDVIRYNNWMRNVD